MTKRKMCVATKLFLLIRLIMPWGFASTVLASGEFVDHHVVGGGVSNECFESRDDDDNDGNASCRNDGVDVPTLFNKTGQLDLEHDNNYDLQGDFTYIPLEELTISPITWRDTGKHVTDYAYEVRIPDTVTNTLLNYCEKTGIAEKFRELAAPGGAMEVDTDGFHNFGSDEYPMTWFIQRPGEQWNSNMHWISPADEASHEDYLRILDEGGFKSVLNTIGEYFKLDGLVCFQLTFIGVSQCDDGYMHYDFSDVDGRGFNVIIPLILTDDSPPELYIEDNETYHETEDGESLMDVGAYKYRIGAAAVIGDDARHSTARVDYLKQGQYRLAATVYIADVNPDNVQNIMTDYTQHYPPRDEDLLLKQAGKHWRPKSSELKQ